MNAQISGTPASEEITSVFVVEDEALIAMELTDRLRSLGYSVSGTASRGEQALEAIVAKQPNVVLMDIHLAGKLTGIETAARLREWSDVPVIFLSAYSDAELLRQAGEVEPFGYLVKPFEERELNATIKMALYRSRMERALRDANARLDEKVRERTAELAKSRENLAVTLRSIGDAVLATDAEGRITSLNPVAEQLTGWAESEALGRPIGEVFRIVNEHTREPAVISLSKVLTTGRTQSLADQTVLVSRNGTELSIADSAAPMRDASNHITGAVLVFRDETEARERRKLIARHRTMLGALRSLQEQFIDSPDAVIPSEDILSVLLYCTGSRTGFIGEVLHAHDGRPYLEVQASTGGSWNGHIAGSFSKDIPESAHDSRLVRQFGAALRSGEPVIDNGDTVNTGAGDASLSGAFLGVPITVAGSVVGMVGVTSRAGGYDGQVLGEIQPLLATYGSLILARRNSVRRRAAEESLRELNANLEAEVRRRTAAQMETEQRYSDLVENINDAIIRDDVEGRLVYANHRFLEWFGLEGTDLRTIVLEDYVAPEWRELLRDRHNRRVRGEKVPERFECEGMGPSGRRMWIDVFVTPVVEHGGIVGTQSVIRDMTERKKIDEALRRSLTMFEALATLSPVGIFHTDAAGECLYVNQRWCDIAAVAPADALGRGWFRSLHIEDRDRITDEWSAAVRSRRSFRSEYRFVHSDGQTTWVLGQAVATTDTAGATTGYIGTVTDVTEQKQLERALRVLSTELVALEGDHYFQVMVERLAALLDCEFAIVGRIESGEHSYLHSLAVFEDGKLADNFSLPIADTPCVDVAAGRSVFIASEAQQRYPADAYASAKDIDAYAAVPLTDRAGNNVGYVGVMSRHPLVNSARIEAILHLFAISAAAEIEHQRSARRFHDLFEFSPDAIVMTDRAGTITLFNRKAEGMFGWDRAEVTGRSIEILVPEEDRVKHLMVRERFVQTPATRPMGGDRPGLRAVRKDGSIFPVEISLGSIQTGEGLMIAAAVRDITDRMNAERQASRAQRLESIGTLAGGIAHDLNNSLTPILMTVDLLKEQYPAEKEVLESVERSANHAVEMVRHLLSFAKGTEGRRVSLEPRRLIKEMETIVKATFPKDVLVQVRMPKELPDVRGDATQLHQVLLNLCVNARDAMAGGGTLTLEADLADAESALAGASELDRTKRYIVFRVSDTGTGIAPEVVDRIFDPFFTTKGPEKGTGLGLFTVAGIVKGHGGSIRVHSRPVHGSTFEVFLPAEETARTTEVVKKSAAGFFGKGETILYVDDESEVRIAARTVLGRLNFTPLIAKDAMSGLSLAIQHRENLRAVITDLHMPRMDGVAFIRTLRRSLPNIPIIVASGRLEGAAVTSLKQLGVSVILNKPFTQEMLANALRNALTTSRITAAPADG